VNLDDKQLNSLGKADSERSEFVYIVIEV